MKRPGRSRLAATPLPAALVWIAPYLALAVARYGFGQEQIGQPVDWLVGLAGIQLFATVALAGDLRVSRALAVVAGLFYVAYFAGVLPVVPASSVLPQLCISALMAISLWLPFSSGQLSLAQGGFMAIGAYGSAWLTTQQGWPFLPALLSGAASAALLGFIVSYPALRLRGVYLAVATLGLGEVIRNALLNFDAVGGAFGYSGIPRYTQTWHLLLALAATSLLLFMLMRGRIGRAAWAVRKDEIAAAAVGIDATRIRILTFTLGAFVAGVAGALQAHYMRFITPDSYGLGALIEWLVYLMLGGYDVFLGAIAGTVAVGTLPELIRFLSDWRLLLNGLILVALLILRPGGILTRELLGWRLSPRPPRLSPQPGPPAAPARPTQPDQPELLALEGVGKRFGGLTALEDVAFTVCRHRIHGLIGPNGAGKTTLFNAVTGIYPIDQGRILLDGRPIQNLAPPRVVRSGITRTFQNIRLYADLTVLENVMLGAHTRMRSTALHGVVGLDRGEERATARRARRLLDLLGLGDRSAAPAGSLSYGDQRRLEIARALASDPRLLVLDEPGAGMNEAEIASLGRLLRRLRDEFGKTILLIEHDIGLVMGLCDSVTVLDFGFVIADGPPGAVQGDPAVIAAYLGQPATRRAPACAAARAAPQPRRQNRLLSIERLVVRYGPIEAVKGVSMHVAEGEIVALIGANGAGKTTTLGAVCGVLPVAGGAVRLQGRAITGWPTHRIAGLGIRQILEGRGVLGSLTVRENLLAGAYTRRDRRAAARDMDALLDRFPRLRERLSQPASTLSGGEQQMLAIARALVSRPRILLLDEPSMGLAPLVAQGVFDLLVELNREGLAMLLVEQNATKALAISHRAYVLAQGTVVAAGDSSALARDARVLGAYLGSSRSDEGNAAVSAAH